MVEVTVSDEENERRYEAIEASLLASGAGAFDVANIDFTNGAGERAQVKTMTVNMMHKKLPMQLG